MKGSGASDRTGVPVAASDSGSSQAVHARWVAVSRAGGTGAGADGRSGMRGGRAICATCARCRIALLRWQHPCRPRWPSRVRGCSSRLPVPRPRPRQWARERNQPVVARGLHRDRVPVGLGDRTIDVGDLGNRGDRLADLPRRSGVDHPEQGRRVRVAVRRCDSDAKQSGRRTPKGARRPPLEWRPGSPMQGQESPDPTLGAGALLLR